MCEILNHRTPSKVSMGSPLRRMAATRQGSSGKRRAPTSRHTLLRSERHQRTSFRAGGNACLRARRKALRNLHNTSPFPLQRHIPTVLHGRLGAASALTITAQSLCMIGDERRWNDFTKVETRFAVGALDKAIASHRVCVNAEAGSSYLTIDTA